MKLEIKKVSIKQIRSELSELGYPVEDFSDQKVIRIYPKALACRDDMYNALISSGFPVDEMSEQTIKNVYKRSVGYELPLFHFIDRGAVHSENIPHRMRGDKYLQNESYTQPGFLTISDESSY